MNRATVSTPVNYCSDVLGGSWRWDVGYSKYLAMLLKLNLVLQVPTGNARSSRKHNKLLVMIVIHRGVHMSGMMNNGLTRNGDIKPICLKAKPVWCCYGFQLCNGKVSVGNSRSGWKEHRTRTVKKYRRSRLARISDEVATIKVYRHCQLPIYVLHLASHRNNL